MSRVRDLWAAGRLPEHYPEHFGAAAVFRWVDRVPTWIPIEQWVAEKEAEELASGGASRLTTTLDRDGGK